MVFCGDLNSSPQGSVFEYINTGTLPADCCDYFNGKSILLIQDNSHQLDVSKNKLWIRMYVTVTVMASLSAYSVTEPLGLTLGVNAH